MISRARKGAWNNFLVGKRKFFNRNTRILIIETLAGFFWVLQLILRHSSSAFTSDKEFFKNVIFFEIFSNSLACFSTWDTSRAFSATKAESPLTQRSHPKENLLRIHLFSRSCSMFFLLLNNKLLFNLMVLADFFQLCVSILQFLNQFLKALCTNTDSVHLLHK